MFTLTPDDQAAIQKLFQDYGEAWGRRDAAACAALYARDGDAIALDGAVCATPAEIEQYYARQLSGAYRDYSISEIEHDPPRAIGRNVALMNGTWMLHGPKRPVRVHATFVMRREHEGWRYVAARFMAPFRDEA